MNRFFATTGFVALSLLSACADDAAVANKLLVESNNLIEQANLIADTKKRAELLSNADDNLQKIVQAYPGTPLAVQLSTGQSIGQISLEKTAKLKQQAEKEAKKEAKLDECFASPTAECIVVVISDSIRELREKPHDSGNTSSLLAFVDDLEKIHKMEETIGSTAASQARAGDSAGALKSVLEIRDEKPRVLAFVEIAKAQAGKGDLVSAKKTLSDALKVAQRLTGDNDHEGVLIKVAIGLAEVNEIPEALKTAIGIKIAAYLRQALDGIAGAQADAGDIRGALKTAETLVPATQELSPGMSQVGKKLEKLSNDQKNDNSGALYRIAIVQAKADVAAALKTAERISGVAYHDGALSYIAGKVAEKRDIPAAFKLVGKISSVQNRNSAIGSIAQAQADAGDVIGARHTVRGIVKQSNEHGGWDDRDEALSSIDRAQRRRLFSIIRKQRDAGDFAGAQETAQRISDDTDRKEFLFSIQIKAGNFSSAQKIIESMTSTKHRALAFSELAEALAKAKDATGSRDALSNSVELAQSISDTKDKAVTLYYVGHLQADTGDQDSAKTTMLIALKTADGISDVVSRAEAFSSIARSILDAQYAHEVVWAHY